MTQDRESTIARSVRKTANAHREWPPKRRRREGEITVPECSLRRLSMISCVDDGKKDMMISVKKGLA